MKIFDIKTIIERYPKLFEFVKFGMVGCIALIVLYAIYYLLLRWTGRNIAYTIGYIVSFLCNYILTIKFTFRTKASKKNAAGFAFSHVVNYLMQVGCLNLFVYIGMPEQLAPFPVFAICVPVNFFLVRLFIKHK